MVQNIEPIFKSISRTDGTHVSSTPLIFFQKKGWKEVKGGGTKFFFLVQNKYKMMMSIWSQSVVNGAPACPQDPHRFSLQNCSKIVGTKFLFGATKRYKMCTKWWDHFKLNSWWWVCCGHGAQLSKVVEIFSHRNETFLSFVVQLEALVSCYNFLLQVRNTKNTKPAN